MYPSPFSSGRYTLKSGTGVFVDFEAGRVVEIDIAGSASGIHLGAVTIGSDVNAVTSKLGIAASSDDAKFVYTARDGEIVELRLGGSEHRVQVFAVVGDKSHAPQSKKANNVVLRNSGK